MKGFAQKYGLFLYDLPIWGSGTQDGEQPAQRQRLPGECAMQEAQVILGMLDLLAVEADHGL